MAIRDFNLPPYEPGGPQLVPPRRSPVWKRAVTWILAALTFLILLAFVAVLVVLHSARFHTYVVQTVEQEASASLNTRVTLQNYALHLPALRLDLYGLTVDGVGPGANAPLLQVDHIGLGVRVISVFHRQWNLDEVAVDRPVVHVIVDQAGHNNLPHPQPSNSNTNIFDLAVRHVLLDRGEVYYNDRKSLLDVDLRDLQLQSSYDAADGGRYFGNLSYRDGHLQYGTYAPIPHDLQAQFDARRDRFGLNNVLLKSGNSQVRLDASLEDYSSPKVHATYAITLDGGELRAELKNPSLPAGTVITEGTADYVSVVNRAVLDTTTVAGRLSSSGLQFRTPSLRTDLRDLAANYNLANGNAAVSDLRGRILGGQLSGSATLRDISGKSQGHVAAAVRGVSLADLKVLANASGLKAIAITGRVNADADANWSGNANDLVARVNATANGNVKPARQNGAQAIPVDAVIHARYANANQTIALDQSFVRTPQTSINANGTVSNHSVLQVQVRANDLHELETLADVFTTPTPGQPAPTPLGLSGTASFNGTVRGSTSVPQIAGQLNANNVTVRGSSFRMLRTGVQASPSQVSLQNGVLEVGRQGRATFNVQTGLHQWSYTPASPFVVNLTASQLSIAELAKAANASVPVTGTLDANIAVHGTQRNPIGQGHVDLKNASVEGEPIQVADARFQGTGDEVHANL
ncbi:MAG: AsmA family protein, partial [Candidatus Korobacteraceae bacterium]